MGVLDLKTDLKSLKYGSDRPGGGDSGLPYIKNDINNPKITLGKFDDGLIRGGVIGATKASIIDTVRIGKFLTNIPEGPLFIARQVGLQLSNPRLEVPKNPINIAAGGISNVLAASTNGLLEPTRIYNLGLNTIAQIPVNAFGGHFSRHGILPVQNENSKYEAVVKANNDDLFSKSKNNRLVKLTTKFGLGDRKGNQSQDRGILSQLGIIANLALGNSFIGNLFRQTPEQLIIDEYAGGPDSTYGIGNTLIKRYSFTEDGFKINLAFTQSRNLSGKTLDKNGNVVEVNYSNTVGIGDKAIIKYGNGISNDLNKIKEGINANSINYTSPALKKYSDVLKAVEKQKLLTSNMPNQFGIWDSKAKSFSSKNVGKISYKNSYDETLTIKMPNWSEASREIRVGSHRKDEINLTPLFSSTEEPGNYVNIPNKGSFYTRDLIKFRIGSINVDSNDKLYNIWMVFRAYLTGFQDSYTGDWNDIKYAGRGEKFKIYNGFDRSVSFSFKVAALSSKEMEPMYQKLNYLASNMMPDYNGILMRGPLMKVTVGDYLNSQPGVITSLQYSVSDDTPWEISLDHPEGGSKMYDLPHIINVNMTFVPIGVKDGELPQKDVHTPVILQSDMSRNNKVNPWVNDFTLENGSQTTTRPSLH